MTDLTLAALDSDGALQETAEKAGFDTRSDFFRKSMVAGGGLVAAGAFGGVVMPALAGAATPKSDAAILNFALTLEYLEAEFYKQAVAANFGGQTGAVANTIYKHEAAHVAYLKKALGKKAVKSPKFAFGKATTDKDTFLATAYVLENTGVQAYLGQVGKIKTPAILAAAATILTIEARHAGAIALVTNKLIAPNGAFDKPKSKAAILKAVKGTGFIQS